MTKPKTIADVRADRRVREVWREDNNGWWASLAPGCCFENCSSLHEMTIKQLCSSLWRVTVCGTPEAHCNNHVAAVDS